MEDQTSDETEDNQNNPFQF